MDQKRFFVLIGVSVLLIGLGVFLTISGDKGFGLMLGSVGLIFLGILVGRSL
jgi:hypothetical protein